jgi:myo-inositol catabolism protein IolS
MLGLTGMEVSVVGLGTWQLGGEWGRTYAAGDVAAIFDEARRQGITLVDTAECYGDHVSERLVGAAVKRDRDRWIIATKFGHRYTGGFDREQRWSAQEVRVQLEDSLRALDTDHIDLYQFHSGRSDAFQDDELWAMLARQREAGKIRHIGISISSSVDAGQQVAQARGARGVGVEMLQIVYNRLQPDAETSLFPLCRAHSLGVFARVPLASGFLSGKYGEGVSFGPTDVRSSRRPEELARLAAEAARVQREEVPAGVQMAAWALAWCLRDPVVTAVIPGCKDAAQVAANASAAELAAK